MGRDTIGSIGKVIPLRQHKRDPASGSAVTRLLTRGVSGRASGGDPGPTATLEGIESAPDAIVQTRAELAEVERRFPAALREPSVARANLAAAQAREGDVAIALEQATALRAEVVHHARTAARSLDLTPATVLDLVR